eukprot:s530_g30.t1
MCFAPQRRALFPSGRGLALSVTAWSRASSRSQWALPDFSCQPQIAMGTAGLQPRAPDPSGHCRTSIASSRSQWALPDLNRELQIPVGNAARAKVQWAAPDLNGERPNPVGNAGPQPGGSDCSGQRRT